MRQPILLTVLCIGLARAAGAQPPSGQAQDIAPIAPQRHYNGIVAGEEAYLANDARREAEIGRQFNLNADMYWRWSGVSSFYPGVFEAWPLVPGEIVGWPAGVSPPRFSSTSVRSSPLAHWASVAAPAAGFKAAPRHLAPRSEPAPTVTAADANRSPGGLPGFVPQAEPTDGQQPKSDPQSKNGPRAF
jgi:hypothetical protein